MHRWETQLFVTLARDRSNLVCSHFHELAWLEKVNPLPPASLALFRPILIIMLYSVKLKLTKMITFCCVKSFLPKCHLPLFRIRHSIQSDSRGDFS